MRHSVSSRPAAPPRGRAALRWLGTALVLRIDVQQLFALSLLNPLQLFKLAAALGDAVAAKQPLVEVDSVAVGDAQAAYLEARALLDLARRNHRRVKQALSEISTLSIGIIQGHVAQRRTRGRDAGATGERVRDRSHH